MERLQAEDSGHTRAMARSTEALARFKASTDIDYEKWHDGVGYDLDALRALTGADRDEAERWLLHRAGNDWRDLEGLLALGSPAARHAVIDQLRHGKLEQRLWAASYLHDDPVLAADPTVAHDIEVTAVAGVLSATIMNGMTVALDLADELRTPPVIDALFRACLLPGDTQVHAAALLAYIHGHAREAFDWERRAFFLQFNDADPAIRRTAFEQLCRECGADPARYLGT
jgi:hypothetical protein